MFENYDNELAIIGEQGGGRTDYRVEAVGYVYDVQLNNTDEIGESLSETGQPLMRPEEIMSLGPTQQLLLVKGMNSVIGGRLPVWFFAPWREWLTVNPVEGDYPNEKPVARFLYSLRK